MEFTASSVVAVGSAVVGSAVVGSAVVGCAVVGSAVVGSAVVGLGVVVPQSAGQIWRIHGPRATHWIRLGLANCDLQRGSRM